MKNKTDSELEERPTEHRDIFMNQKEFERLPIQQTVCGIPADGIEAIYWDNTILWERTKVSTSTKG